MNQQQAIDYEYKLHSKYIDVMDKLQCWIMVDHKTDKAILLNNKWNVYKEFDNVDELIKFLNKEQKAIKPFPLVLNPPAWKLRQIVQQCKESILLVKQNRDYFSDDFDYDMIQSFENILNLLKG